MYNDAVKIEIDDLSRCICLIGLIMYMYFDSIQVAKLIYEHYKVLASGDISHVLSI